MFAMKMIHGQGDFWAHAVTSEVAMLGALTNAFIARLHTQIGWREPLRRAQASRTIRLRWVLYRWSEGRRCRSGITSPWSSCS